MAVWFDVEDDPSTFLKSFPSYRLHSEPQPLLDRLWVFSSKDERYENNSYSSDDAGTRTMIYDKTKSIFSKMDYRLGTIVQFWAPVTIGGKLQLSTSGQPFAVSDFTKDLIKYRRRCVEEYGYDIDVNSNNSKLRGTPVSAFLNHFTEIASMHTNVHHEVDPLLRYAFQECSLTTSFMIPICCPSQNSSSSDCIGVIECSSWLIDPVHLFNDTNMKIKEVGLSVYNVQDRIPYKTINGLELARDQIQEALKIVCQSHQITLAQLVTYKLMGWDWYAAGDGGMGLTICMRSIHTGDFNYVFEFLWNHNSFNPILLEEILLKIKSCLPSFKFASGTEIGDKLPVTEVDNSTHKRTKKFDIFQLKRLSPIPDAMNKGKKVEVVNYNALSKEKRDTSEKKLSREDIEQHYGKTEKQAAKDLGVSLSTLKRKRNKLGMSGWQGPDLSQRKAYSSNKNQSKESHSHEKDNGVIQDPSPVKRNENTVIKAEYADDIIRLHLPISEATFVTVENEIGKEFKLKHGTFKINYRDEDEEWILMKTDQDLNDCIQSSRNVDRSVVRLRVRLHNQ